MTVTQTTQDTVVNLSISAQEAAKKFPYKRAIIFPEGRDSRGHVSYTQLTFEQLSHDIDAYARGLRSISIGPGMRVCFLMTPSLEFLPITFALFKIGAVPVLIDPGMGKQNLLSCIRSAAPEALIGVPRAHVARKLYSSYFQTVKIGVTIGRRYFWGGPRLEDIYLPGECPAPTTKAEDMAAIIFTTGSTGPPKGAVYTHGMFCAQRDLLRDEFNLSSDDVDMPAFALFSIFTLAMGCTVVIPDMDQTRPAEANPKKIIEAIENHAVTFCFGSPALWNTVSKYCVEHETQFKTLKKVFMAGAPIPPYLHKRMLEEVLPKDGEVYTPYGATEALPITSFKGSAVLKETAERTARGHGFCVGKVLGGNEVKIIKIVDEIIGYTNEIEELPRGEIGEIIVRGDVVSREYFRLADKTAEHKIYETEDEKGPFWHRIGDLGYFDEEDRLWMCGRKTHRVETSEGRLFSVCCEAIFNQHKDVFRAALVGIGDDPAALTPVMIIEPEQGKFPTNESEVKRFKDELFEIGRAEEKTKAIQTILFHKSFPVDIRHNAKIFREQLRTWAKEELAK